MKLLRALGEFLRRDAPAEPQNPFGLSLEEIQAIREAASSAGWDVYVRALDAFAQQQGEALLTASQPAKLHYLRGLIQGVRYAAMLPTVLEDATNDDASRKRERELIDRRDRRRAAALYATGSWQRR